MFKFYFALNLYMTFPVNLKKFRRLEDDYKTFATKCFERLLGRNQYGDKL